MLHLLKPMLPNSSLVSLELVLRWLNSEHLLAEMEMLQVHLIMKPPGELLNTMLTSMMALVVTKDQDSSLLMLRPLLMLQLQPGLVVMMLMETHWQMEVNSSRTESQPRPPGIQRSRRQRPPRAI